MFLRSRRLPAVFVAALASIALVAAAVWWVFLKGDDAGGSGVLVAIPGPVVEGWEPGTGLRIIGPRPGQVRDIGEGTRFAGPAWSPDGSRLLVAAVIDPDTEDARVEWRMLDSEGNLRGSWEPAPFDIGGPTWASDSSAVALGGQRVRFFSRDLKLLAESEPLGLPEGSGPRPTWSPRLDAVALVAGPVAAVVMRDGTAQRFTLAEDGLALWLPTGELAIGSRSGITTAKVWDPQTGATETRTLDLFDASGFSARSRRFAAVNERYETPVWDTADDDHWWTAPQGGPSAPLNIQITVGGLDQTVIAVIDAGAANTPPRSPFIDVVVR